MTKNNETKSSAQHTPGPWCREKQGNVLKGANGEFVVSLNWVGGHDARLIAAAPDLLAALVRAAATLEGAGFQSAAAAARAAIAKARGAL